MGMSEAEKQQLIEVVHGMSEEQLAVVASETPPEILLYALLDQTRDMRSRILLTADALQGRTMYGSEREISVIGGI